jgi:two-component system response regulator DegU
MDPIALMLVDDHDLVRTSLKTFLETQPDIEVIAEAETGEAAMHMAQSRCPEVILLDISMANSIEATRRLKISCPKCKVLALGDFTERGQFLEIMAAGALGFITKDVAAQELLQAIRIVADGGVALRPNYAAWLLEDYQRLLSQPMVMAGEDLSKEGKSHRDPGLLSEREIQVLQLVAEGLSNQAIGEMLGISHKTVARHRERLMKKLEIHSTTELVKFAIRSGLAKLG